MSLLGFGRAPAPVTVPAADGSSKDEGLCLSPHVVVSHDAKSLSDAALDDSTACVAATATAAAAGPTPTDNTGNCGVWASLGLVEQEPAAAQCPASPHPMQPVTVLATETADEATQRRTDQEEREQAAAMELATANERALAAALAENEQLKQRLSAMHSLITGGLHQVLEEAHKISPPPSQTATPRAGSGEASSSSSSSLFSTPGKGGPPVESIKSWQQRLVSLVTGPALCISAGVGSVATAAYVRWPRTRFARLCATTLAAAAIYGGLRYSGRIGKIELGSLLPRIHNSGAATAAAAAAAASCTSPSNGGTEGGGVSSGSSALMTAASVVEAGVKESLGHLKFAHHDDLAGI
jgi:hypothetical protein